MKELITKNSAKELFIGRLGKNPDLRYTRSLKPVCYLSVAETRESEGQTVWHKVVVWGKQAELCSLYLQKGKEVFVKGKMELKEFMTSEGNLKKYKEINASLIGFSNL
jgi:single-strand DNA-binding protein